MYMKDTMIIILSIMGLLSSLFLLIYVINEIKKLKHMRGD
jgi:hypothetical protein